MDPCEKSNFDPFALSIMRNLVVLSSCRFKKN